MKDLVIEFDGKGFFLDDVLLLEDTIVNWNIKILVAEVNLVRKKKYLFGN